MWQYTAQTSGASVGAVARVADQTGTTTKPWRKPRLNGVSPSSRRKAAIYDLRPHAPFTKTSTRTTPQAVHTHTQT